MGLVLPADFLAKVDDIACYKSSDRFVVAAGIVPVLSGHRAVSFASEERKGATGH